VKVQTIALSEINFSDGVKPEVALVNFTLSIARQKLFGEYHLPRLQEEKLT
jgi:hypothetical protein